MRLAALLWRLTRARVSLEKSGDAIGYLAPVLCVTADDRIRFEEIVSRHDLVDAWATFERQFLADTP